ncbi:Mbeg1-like protein [Streptococcus intermedius]
MSENYTDYERKQIAQKEYDNSLVKGSPVNIGQGKSAKTIGTVREVITDKTGLKAYVVESPDKKEVSVLYQGSVAPPGEGYKVDWFDNDFPMAKNIMTGKQEVTPQLKSAATTLNKVLKDYPKAKVTVYAHSLGSMDAQYALANVKDINRIAGAYIYQGPNIYPVLTEEQRKRVDAMKYRIHNYIDQRDAIPIGFEKDAPGYKATLNSHRAVGIVHHVDSKWNLNPIEQHMWGGYQWNSDGSLKVKKDSSAKESRYAAGLDRVSSGMYHYASIKSKLSSGGYTKNEKIFLDSEQASITASGLSKVAQASYEEIKRIQEEAHREAEAILSSTREVPFGFILSPAEMEEAYRQGGVDRKSIVDNIDEYFQPKVAKAKQLAKDFQNLEKQIKSGIQRQVDRDATLARDFKQWKKL